MTTPTQTGGAPPTLPTSAAVTADELLDQVVHHSRRFHLGHVSNSLDDLDAGDRCERLRMRDGNDAVLGTPDSEDRDRQRWQAGGQVDRLMTVREDRGGNRAECLGRPVEPLEPEDLFGEATGDEAFVGEEERQDRL